MLNNNRVLINNDEYYKILFEMDFQEAFRFELKLGIFTSK